MVEYTLAAIKARIHSLVLEPRGFAKSTWDNTILMSWLIAQNPALRVGLISKSATHAYGFSSAIRRTIERSPEFREAFGHQVGDIKWTDAEWMVRDSPLQGTKDVNCFAQGVGGQIVSKRFDVILCDDILDGENTANPEQMRNNETWFWKTLYPCLAPDGVIIVLGTRWADGDLYGTLLATEEEGGKGWPHLVRSALIVDPEAPTGFRSLWPEYFPVKHLFEMRRNMGLAQFACAMLNDITGLMTGNIFNPQDFQHFSALPTDRKWTVRMGVDLASSTKTSADYTARVTTAEDEEGNFYVLSYHREKISSGHAAFIYDGWAAYPNVAAVVVENQQFQSTLVAQVMRDHPRIPVIGRRADADKETRARAVAARYEAHKVWHHVSLKDSPLEIEEASFPKGHDDLVDALGYSMDLSGAEFSFGFARAS
jgi:predicted phage terminase large subunit-like protein